MCCGFCDINWTEMGSIMVVEARKCVSQSHSFRGLCLSDQNCATVCLTEGFTEGYCRGFRQRCFCYKPCLKV